MSALLLPNEILSMSAQAARLLVESGDGDGALLYLALLECGGEPARAAARLRWGEERLGPAWARLSALGLVQPRENAPTPAPAEDGRLLLCIMRDVTDEETEREKKENISRQTIEIADKVVDKQMRVVQEIASLLGETAAETKIALTKLKESIDNE